MQTSQLILYALIPLIAWRLYARIRRMVGRQRSRPWRHWVAAVLWPLLAVMLAVGALAHPTAEGALAVGLAAGIGLGIWGILLTRFERTAEGWFYTPSAHIGIAVSILFVARIAWRLVELQSQGMARADPDFARSPLTLLVFGVLAAYYATYAAGLLRWRQANASPRR
jgi:cytochrome b561